MYRLISKVLTTTVHSDHVSLDCVSTVEKFTLCKYTFTYSSAYKN